MFHRHVVAFLKHWVIDRYVSSWSNHFVGASIWDVTIMSFIFKSLFTSIEDNSIFQMFISRLTKSFRSLLTVLFFILSWAWHFKLKTLPIKHLVIIEAGWGSVEPYSLPRKVLIVSCSHLPCPLRPFSHVRDYASTPTPCTVPT